MQYLVTTGEGLYTWNHHGCCPSSVQCLEIFLEILKFAKGGNSLRSSNCFSVILFICLHQQTPAPAEPGLRQLRFNPDIFLPARLGDTSPDWLSNAVVPLIFNDHFTMTGLLWLSEKSVTTDGTSILQDVILYKLKTGRAQQFIKTVSGLWVCSGPGPCWRCLGYRHWRYCRSAMVNCSAFPPSLQTPSLFCTFGLTRARGRAVWAILCGKSQWKSISRVSLAWTTPVSRSRAVSDTTAFLTMFCGGKSL